MTATHTPGPWQCECPNGYFLIYGPTGHQIHNSFNSSDSETIEANARLIASAPALLEALRKTRAYLATIDDSLIHDPEDADIYAEIDAAIRAAATEPTP